jgi:hypothetical protein
MIFVFRLQKFIVWLNPEEFSAIPYKIIASLKGGIKGLLASFDVHPSGHGKPAFQGRIGKHTSQRLSRKARKKRRG